MSRFAGRRSLSLCNRGADGVAYETVLTKPNVLGRGDFIGHRSGNGAKGKVKKRFQSVGHRFYKAEFCYAGYFCEDAFLNYLQILRKQQQRGD